MTNPVTALDTTTRDRRLLDSFKKADTVRQSTRHANEWLVSSNTHANVSYRVSYDREAGRFSCGCEWWTRTQTACRHLVRVSWHEHQERKRVSQFAGHSSAAAD